MAKKMTSRERMELHERQLREHREKSLEALRMFVRTDDRAFWEEYKAEEKEASRQWGIIQGMFTRLNKKHGIV